MTESIHPHFIHLHLHTEYSLVDGLVDVKALVKRCAALKMPAVAVTDQSNLFALVKFYKAALETGIKPIVGMDVHLFNEADPAAPHALTLYVQNEAGYRNLTELISRAYLKNQQHEKPQIMAHWLESQNEGLIALSGGRLGDIGHALLEGHPNEARRLLEHWLKVFDQRFYLEVQRTGRPNEAEYLEQAIDLSLEFEAPIVATNDVRFLHPTDFEAHEARVCINQGRILDDPRRPRDYTDQQYLKSPEEMVELFADLPEALENSVEIAKRCNIGLTLGKNFLPNFPVPEGLSIEEFFAQETRRGLQERLAVIFPKEIPAIERKRQFYQDRLEMEISVINQMRFPGYFLIVADFIQWAKNNGIPVGPGRGSGAGSLVAYALKITDLDPIQFELLFERFLNPERVSMPDFDVDFCMERRDEVIEYVAETYGRDRVSQIITYGSMAAKAVVRDVGRVLGHSYGFVDRIAKLIPFELGMTLDKALTDSEDLRKLYETDEEVKTLIDLAKSLEGITRNPGKHAGGVVISPSRLVDFAPLYCEPDGTNLVTQFDKDDVEAVGLVKFDFLGLRTLTIIDWALATINRQREKSGEPPIDINRIPHDDPETYELLKHCATTAVFQLESRGMKDLIRRLQPDNFEDIIALVALFRPGPLQSGMVDDYINVKHGRAKAEYPHPTLEPILKTTNGVILYQEQVMQIARDMAGYTLGGADLLRRCLSGSSEVVAVTDGRVVTLAEMAAAPEEWLGREILSLNLATLSLEARPIEAIYPNGIREVFTLATHGGRTLRATADHLLYTSNGWQVLCDFSPGQSIAVTAGLPLEAKLLWDEVISISYFGREDVFDLTVGPHHNFVANGVIVHNCMGKKKPEEMAQQRTTFLEGSVKNQVNPDVANYIFDLMEKFAGYGFNKTLHAETEIITKEGIKKIREVCPGDEVFARNPDGSLSPTRVVARHDHGLVPLWEISFDDGTVESCTLDHKWLTRYGHLPLWAIIKRGEFVWGYSKSLTNPLPSPAIPERSLSERILALNPLFDETQQRQLWQVYLAQPDPELDEPSRWQADSQTLFRKPVRATFQGWQPGYDLEVEHPEHHFLLASGLYCSNSHSAAYALVSYQTAWLKTHFPAAFMAAVLSSDMDNTDKIVILVEECRELKLKLQAPDVNRSDFHFTVLDNGAILYGLGAIKGVGEMAIQDILEERNRGGPYQDLYDLCRRVDLRKANRRVLEALIRGGALDALDPNRARHIAELPDALKSAEQHGNMAETGQNDLFGLVSSEALQETPHSPMTVEAWSENERLAHEKATLGLYLTGHPIGPYEDELRNFITNRLSKLVEGYDKPIPNARRQENRVVVAGLVVDLRSRQSKTGKRMAFLTLDDRTGRLELAIFSETLEKYRDYLVKDALLVAEGNLGFDEFLGHPRLTVERLLSIEQAREVFAKHLLIQWPELDSSHERSPRWTIDELQELLEAFQGGQCPIIIEYANRTARTLLELGGAWRVRPADQLLEDLSKRIGSKLFKLQY
jgi:DNA-directed DNA polymerase III PolC